MLEKPGPPETSQANNFSSENEGTLVSGTTGGCFLERIFITGDRLKDGKEADLLYGKSGSQERVVTKGPALGVNNLGHGRGVVSQIVTSLRYSCTFSSVLASFCQLNTNLFLIHKSSISWDSHGRKED